MILFILTRLIMELKIGEVKTYQGLKVKCIKDSKPGEGCNLCDLFGNCRDMICSAKDRKDGQYTHFKIQEDGKQGVETN